MNFNAFLERSGQDFNTLDKEWLFKETMELQSVKYGYWKNGGFVKVVGMDYDRNHDILWKKNVWIKLSDKPGH